MREFWSEYDAIPCSPDVFRRERLGDVPTPGRSEWKMSQNILARIRRVLSTYAGHAILGWFSSEYVFALVHLHDILDCERPGDNTFSEGTDARISCTEYVRSMFQNLTINC